MRSITEGILVCRQCGRGRTYYRDVHIWGDKDSMNECIGTQEIRESRTKKLLQVYGGTVL